MEVVIFDQDYLHIPLQDMPDEGHLIVCHDPQKRLGYVTWAVCLTKSDNGGSPPGGLGLFWDKGKAVFFANAYADLGE